MVDLFLVIKEQYMKQEDIKEGCSIIEKQAELLKIKFGSAWPCMDSIS